MTDLLEFLAGILLLMFIVFAGIFTVGDIIQRSECAKIARITGHPTHYPDTFNLDEGCYVKTQKGWVPLRVWRVEGP